MTPAPRSRVYCLLCGKGPKGHPEACKPLWVRELDDRAQSPYARSHINKARPSHRLGGSR